MVAAHGIRNARVQQRTVSLAFTRVYSRKTRRSPRTFAWGSDVTLFFLGKTSVHIHDGVAQTMLFAQRGVLERPAPVFSRSSGTSSRQQGAGVKWQKFTNQSSG